MANLIVVCGPQAVGKMTVAESLRDKLKYNMMMNHDSIEASDRIFGFATQTFFNKLSCHTRQSIHFDTGITFQFLRILVQFDRSLVDVFGCFEIGDIDAV